MNIRVVIGVLLFVFVWFFLSLSVNSQGSILRVVNKSMSSQNFRVSQSVDTATFLGSQSKAINTEVDGYKAYKDDNVIFYVENPLLKNKESQTFFIHFKTNNATCGFVFLKLNLEKLPIKDITLNGESVKSFLKYSSRKYFFCGDSTQGEKTKKEDRKYEADLRYEVFY